MKEVRWHPLAVRKYLALTFFALLHKWDFTVDQISLKKVSKRHPFWFYLIITIWYTAMWSKYPVGIILGYHLVILHLPVSHTIVFYDPGNRKRQNAYWRYFFSPKSNFSIQLLQFYFSSFWREETLSEIITDFLWVSQPSKAQKIQQSIHWFICSEEAENILRQTPTCFLLYSHLEEIFSSLYFSVVYVSIAMIFILLYMVTQYLSH